MSSGKCKSKQHQIPLTHILEQPKSGTLTASNVMGMENRSPHVLLVEMQNDRDTLEESLMLSCKTRYSLTIQFNSLTLDIYTKEMKNMSANRPAHQIYSSFFHISKFGNNQHVLQQQNGKNNQAYLDHRVLFSTKKEILSSH